MAQPAFLGKSPTKTRTTQPNHFFASLYAYITFEKLKIKTKLNTLNEALYFNYSTGIWGITKIAKSCWVLNMSYLINIARELEKIFLQKTW